MELGAVLFAFGVLVLGTSVGAAPTPTATKPFRCEYYNDGTHVCQYYNAVINDYDGEKIEGTWTSDDGFFALPDANEGPRALTGKCEFLSDRSWSCSYPPRTWQAEDGTMRGVGGSLFQGMYFLGVPGGMWL